MESRPQNTELGVRRGCAVLAVLTLLALPVHATPDPPPRLLLPAVEWPQTETIAAWRLQEACSPPPTSNKAQAFTGATWKSVAIVAILATAVVIVALEKDTETEINHFYNGR